MPIAFLISILLTFTASLLPQAPQTENEVVVHYTARSSKTRFDFKTKAGKNYILAVSRDQNVAPNAEPSSVKVVGEIKGTAIIFVDTYPSIPGGMSFCGAGEEGFLRIVSISGRQPIETFRMKVESCRSSIELSSPGIEWDPEKATLRVHRFVGLDDKRSIKVSTIKIDQQGKAENQEG